MIHTKNTNLFRSSPGRTVLQRTHRKQTSLLPWAPLFIIIGIQIQFWASCFIFVNSVLGSILLLHWSPSSWAICSNLCVITPGLIDEVWWPSAPLALHWYINTGVIGRCVASSHVNMLNYNYCQRVKTFWCSSLKKCLISRVDAHLCRNQTHIYSLTGHTFWNTKIWHLWCWLPPCDINRNYSWFVITHETEGLTSVITWDFRYELFADIQHDNIVYPNIWLRYQPILI